MSVSTAIESPDRRDSKRAVAFLREVIAGLRTAFGSWLPLEFRMDTAFCQRAVFCLLAARGCAYAIKVGYWRWLPFGNA